MGKKNKKAKFAELKKLSLTEKDVKKFEKTKRATKKADELLKRDVKRLDALWNTSAAEALRWRPGNDVRVLNCNATPGFEGNKDDAAALTKALQPELADLQERLFANGKEGDKRSILLIIQGLDTAGKGGIVRHVIGLVDPQGVMTRSFGVPTEEEKAHGYLWRLRNAVPQPGYIGVFDRSQYEQVLVVRVDGIEPEEEWRAHYQEINDFEAELSANGVKIIKVAMIVSKDEQRNRLLARLDRPDKLWKYNPNDLDTRAKFDKYLAAYQDMLERTIPMSRPGM